MIKKYIKKPVEIEAIQLTENNIIEIFNFLDDTNYKEFKSELELQEMEDYIQIQGHLVIRTLEGDMKANFGDYIIKGHNNLFYKISAKEFEETYQSVDNFIDLNKLKNYEIFIFGASPKEQIEKVYEEVKELMYETTSVNMMATSIIDNKDIVQNRENIISETLDVITSSYNLLIKLGLTKEDFDKHIEKLNVYKETKYKK